MTQQLHVVTGAFGHTGKYAAGSKPTAKQGVNRLKPIRFAQPDSPSFNLIETGDLSLGGIMERQ